VVNVLINCQGLFVVPVPVPQPHISPICNQQLSHSARASSLSLSLTLALSSGWKLMILLWTGIGLHREKNTHKNLETK